MISRRNIRVKVMQTLYSMERMDKTANPDDALRVLTQKIDQSRLLFSYLIYFLSELSKYAEKDAIKKAGKHLPTQEDLHINTKIAGNELIWKISEDSSFHAVLKDGKFSSLIDQDLLKTIYRQMITTPEYQEYIAEQFRNKKSEKKILDFLFNNLMLPNENFVAHVEEVFINWDDDAEMMQTMVLNYLSKPQDKIFNDILSPEKWQFAKSLLQTVIDKKIHTLEMIKPKLKNWDAERIAALDLILLQMGICEFLYFETIPTKVTINEYIDMAKDYSTVQSGQFVNGLLDNIHQELLAANKIEKRNFKNIPS